MTTVNSPLVRLPFTAAHVKSHLPMLTQDSRQSRKVIQEEGVAQTKNGVKMGQNTLFNDALNHERYAAFGRITGSHARNGETPRARACPSRFCNSKRGMRIVGQTAPKKNSFHVV